MTTELRTAKQIGAMIASVTKRSHTLGAALHEAFMQTLMHAQKHGDTRLIERLMNGLHASQRIASAVAWFEDYSPVAVVKRDGKWAARIRPDTDKNFKGWSIEAAEANPYWERHETNPKEFTILDFMKACNALHRKVENMNDNERALRMARNVPTYTKEQIQLEREAQAEAANAA